MSEKVTPELPGPIGLDSPSDYDASKIKVLEGLEAVRKRPAMYIGSTGTSGLHHLVYEVVDNSVDEAQAGFCTKIDVTVHIDNSVTVVDDGRGIPVDLHKEENKPAAEVVLTILHAGGKFENDAYKVSAGPARGRVSVVNALSERLDLEIWRNGFTWTQTYERGKPVTDFKQGVPHRTRGTKITFKPDPQVFEELVYSYDTLVCAACASSPFLNRASTITLTGRASGEATAVGVPLRRGIVEFVQHLNKARQVCTRRPSPSRPRPPESSSRSPMQWNDSYNETIYSFANSINTIEGRDPHGRLQGRPHPHHQQLPDRGQPGEGHQGPHAPGRGLPRRV
jgi:DNA gyrase subunit B